MNEKRLRFYINKISGQLQQGRAPKVKELVEQAISESVEPKMILEDCISLFWVRSADAVGCLISIQIHNWYTPGWIEHGFTPSVGNYAALLYRKYAETCGEDNAEFLMETENGWNTRYANCTYVDCPVCQDDRFAEYTMNAAEYMNWVFRIEKGDMTFFNRMVDEPWCEEDFLVCPPGSRVERVYDDRKIRAAAI